MSNPVTKRFIECHDKLKEENKVASSRQFALAIDTAPQSLNQVLKGKRDVTVMNVMALVETFGANAEYLLAGYGPMFKEQDEQFKPVKENKIMYVPIDAHAGYCDQFHETVSKDELEFFSVPGYQPNYGEHRCFDVAGDSMEPTLFCGDKIICSLVSPDNAYSNLRDNYVYVIITHGDIVVKRVVNNLKKNGTLLIKSDNNFYTNREIEGHEIKEVWMVKLKISPFMSNPANMRNAFHTEIDGLKQTIKTQADTMQMMNKSLECLLKKSR
ncbi:MAG: S24 family peptidase [Saprospiraceae bacterium]|nr:S24 family peptidase [Saprospiraceae bacterium]